MGATKVVREEASDCSLQRKESVFQMLFPVATPISSRVITATVSAPAKGKKAAAQKSTELIATDDERDMMDHTDVGPSSPVQPQVQPKARPRPKPAFKGKATRDEEEHGADTTADERELEPRTYEPDGGQSVAGDTPAANSSPEPVPASSRKRPRNEDDEEEDAELNGDGGEEGGISTDGAQRTVHEKPSSQGSQASVSEFKTRHKRARR